MLTIFLVIAAYVLGGVAVAILLDMRGSIIGITFWPLFLGAVTWASVSTITWRFGRWITKRY